MIHSQDFVGGGGGAFSLSGLNYSLHQKVAIMDKCPNVSLTLPIIRSVHLGWFDFRKLLLAWVSDNRVTPSKIANGTSKEHCITNFGIYNTTTCCAGVRGVRWRILSCLTIQCQYRASKSTPNIFAHVLSDCAVRGTSGSYHWPGGASACQKLEPLAWQSSGGKAINQEFDNIKMACSLKSWPPLLLKEWFQFEVIRYITIVWKGELS